MMSGGGGIVFSAMDDRNAERESAAMQRCRRLTVPGGKELAILDVDVLDVELDSRVPVLLTELQEAPGRARTPRCVRQKFSQRAPVARLVDDEGHYLDALRFGQ